VAVKSASAGAIPHRRNTNRPAIVRGRFAALAIETQLAIGELLAIAAIGQLPPTDGLLELLN